ncbi:MAG: helix-turn-helix domain-containing protein [Alphaproteobacteria bacterium]
MTPRESLKAARAYVRIIQIEASKEFCVELTDLLSSRREQTKVDARMAAIWIASKKTNLNSSELGRLFNKDHTTILNSLKVIGQRLKWDDDYSARLDAITDRLDGKPKHVNNNMVEVLADLAIASMETLLLGNPSFKAGLISVLTNDPGRRYQLLNVFNLSEETF